ncbi:MAG TPA: hypothetical protein VNI54_04155 [Thermoanaerobaculia bacterium]|nr:hypothetical protein [Thermoanaerobaculia bacterium]
MRIFISWSRERSHKVASALEMWIPKVIQATKPWLSSANIDAGVRWGPELTNALDDVNFGILCLTPDNTDEAWLLFEAGALSKVVLHSRVVPYLIGFESRELRGPLSQFQNVQADAVGTFQLLESINETLDERRVSADVLAESFKMWWPSFEAELDAALRMSPVTNPVHAELWRICLAKYWIS